MLLYKHFQNILYYETDDVSPTRMRQFSIYFIIKQLVNEIKVIVKLYYNYNSTDKRCTFPYRMTKSHSFTFSMILPKTIVGLLT